MKYFVSGLPKHQINLYDVVDQIFEPICDSIDKPDNCTLSLEFMKENDWQETCEPYGGASKYVLAQFISAMTKENKKSDKVDEEENTTEEENTNEESIELGEKELEYLRTNDLNVIRFPINLKDINTTNTDRFTYFIAGIAAFMKMMTTDIRLVTIYTNIKESGNTSGISEDVQVAILEYIRTKIIDSMGNGKAVLNECNSVWEVALSEVILFNDKEIVKKILTKLKAVSEVIGTSLALNEEIHSDIVDKIKKESKVESNIKKKLYGYSNINNEAFNNKVDSRIKILSDFKDKVQDNMIRVCDNGECTDSILGELSTDFNEYLAKLGV